MKGPENAVKMVDAVVCFTARLKKAAAFYRAIGVRLDEERHGDGPLHYACDLGATHFALVERRRDGRRVARSRSTMIGFRVPSLRKAVGSARRSGAKVLLAAQEVPWGRRAVVLDPDGRLVELNEAPSPAGIEELKVESQKSKGEVI